MAIAAPPLLITNIGQLLTLQSSAKGPRRGPALREIGLVRDAAVLCARGKVIAAGARGKVEGHAESKGATVYDCGGRVALPGLVDSHTHPVFIEPRLVDFEKRISGASYEEIAEAGGGIRSSVAGVRNASLEQLTRRVLDSLKKMASEGTTTVEAKSGYGLTLESEIKSLQAIRGAANAWPGTVAATFLGAHVVPAEYRSGQDRVDEYVTLLCEEMIPAVAKHGLADSVDVFCERGAFTAEQTQRIFAAARKSGLQVRAHIGQFTETRLDQFAPYQPLSFDHLDHISREQSRMLGKSSTIATILPGAAYFLGEGKFPPVRQLIEDGVGIALATDYNPGTSPTTNLAFILSLACTQMHMTVEEAISAATTNGACALALESRKGSIEPGKDADLAIFDFDDYREIAYWFGSSQCRATVLNGTLLSRA
jgi:imidazolonepropionase